MTLAGGQVLDVFELSESKVALCDVELSLMPAAEPFLRALMHHAVQNLVLVALVSPSCARVAFAEDQHPEDDE